MHEEEGLHIQLASERLFEIWGFPITNSLLAAWVVMLTLFIVALLVRKNLNIIPGRLQNIAEMAFEFVYGYVERTLESKKLAQRYFPLIATIFFFILYSFLF
jgi:F-type H+-transporting ATPase subunit a